MMPPLGYSIPHGGSCFPIAVTLPAANVRAGLLGQVCGHPLSPLSRATSPKGVTETTAATGILSREQPVSPFDFTWFIPRTPDSPSANGCRSARQPVPPPRQGAAIR